MIVFNINSAPPAVFRMTKLCVFHGELYESTKYHKLVQQYCYNCSRCANLPVGTVLFDSAEGPPPLMWYNRTV